MMVYFFFVCLFGQFSPVHSGFLFYLYHLILANQNWSQIEQLWSVFNTNYINFIHYSSKNAKQIGHDLLQFNFELMTLKNCGVKSSDLVCVVQKNLANQNRLNPTKKSNRPELNRAFEV